MGHGGHGIDQRMAAEADHRSAGYRPLPTPSRSSCAIAAPLAAISADAWPAAVHPLTSVLDADMEPVGVPERDDVCSGTRRIGKDNRGGVAGWPRQGFAGQASRRLHGSCRPQRPHPTAGGSHCPGSAG